MPRITVTVDGTAQTVDVAVGGPPNPDLIWRGYPYTAQVDAANGLPRAGTGLPRLAQALNPAGPYRMVECLNRTPLYAYQPQADGSLILEVRGGDLPGGAGGARACIELNEAITPYIDPLGNTDHQARFVRHEYMLPATNAFPLVLHNNFGEIHGNTSGSSPFKFMPNGAGDHVGFQFTSHVLGVPGAPVWTDLHPLVLGHWENYVLELRLSSDPAVGYYRVYRDGVCVSSSTPGADSQGRVFAATQQTTPAGAGVKMAYNVQLYRDPSLVAPSQAQFRNIAIGRTLAAVQAL